MSLPHTILFGSEWLKDNVARPVIAGKHTMCITLTEPQGGPAGIAIGAPVSFRIVFHF